MKNFVEYLLVRLVDNPDELVVESVEIEDGQEIRISVNPEDMGRVIGKGGQVIKAIRKLAQVKAARDGIWVRIVLLEDRVEDQASPKEDKQEESSAPESTEEIVEEIIEEAPAEDQD